MTDTTYRHVAESRQGQRETMEEIKALHQACQVARDWFKQHDGILEHVRGLASTPGSPALPAALALDSRDAHSLPTTSRQVSDFADGMRAVDTVQQALTCSDNELEDPDKENTKIKKVVKKVPEEKKVTPPVSYSGKLFRL